MNNIQLLQYIINGSIDIPARDETIDSAACSEFIRINRLQGRFLKQLERNGKSDVFSDSLVQEIKNQDLLHREHANRLIEAIVEMQDLNKDGLEIPLFIKGASAAILCENPSAIRFSGDIDLFTPDIERTKHLLSYLGYSALAGAPAPHEDSFYRRGDVFVEIHKYFPVLSLPVILDEKLRMMKQLYITGCSTRRLTYSNLLKHSITVNNDTVGKITVTNLEMTAFIISLHAFKDLFHEPFKVPGIRLCELFEIKELFEATEFRLSVFMELCDSFDAYCALEYVFSIMQEVLGFKIPSGFSFVDQPRVKLMNDIFGPYMLADKNYFRKLPFQSFDDIIENIGYCSCKELSSYETFNQSATRYASSNEETYDFSFSLRICDRMLIVKMNIRAKIGSYDNIMIMCGDNNFIHIWLDHYPDNVRLYGNGTYIINEFEDSYSIKITLPFHSCQSRRLILAYGKENDMQKTVTVLPVQLTGSTE